MEELIVGKAKNLFFSYGLKSVTMDDIAREAGMSKKTIYKSFEDKNQLVKRLVDELLQGHGKALQQCSDICTNAIDSIFHSTIIPFNQFAVINPGFLYDLKKFFPLQWKLIEDHREKVLKPFVVSNLERGIDEELYRAEIDIPFIADVRVQQIITAFDVKTFTDRAIECRRLFLQLTEFYLHAITTPKGKKLINKYLNVNNDKQVSN